MRRSPLRRTGQRVRRQRADAAPNVVIVNLEEGAEDDLDHLQALFDDPAINVVFNEAGVSRSLEGWDLARWARHLAAKVLGNDNTMPPPPEGAELLQPRDLMPTPGAVPTPAQLAPEQSMDTFRDEAHTASDAVPADELSGMLSPASAAQTEVAGMSSGNDPTPADDADLEIDFSMLEDALTLQDGPPPERLPPTPESVEEQSLADRCRHAGYDLAANRCGIGGAGYRRRNCAAGWIASGGGRVLRIQFRGFRRGTGCGIARGCLV